MNARENPISSARVPEHTAVDLTSLDIIKVLILFFLYCFFAPALGVVIRKNRKWQKIVFFAMCFMTIGGFFQAAEWGLTVDPILYRGTARGFHFFWAEVAAVALIVADMTGDWKNFKFTPSGDASLPVLLLCQLHQHHQRSRASLRLVCRSQGGKDGADLDCGF